MAVNLRVRTLPATSRKSPRPSQYRTRPLPYDFSTITRPTQSQFIVLVEIDWDSGTKGYSYQEERKPLLDYEPLVKSISQISRESPPTAQVVPVSNVRIVLFDSDSTLTKLKAAEPFYQRKVRVYAGDARYGFTGLSVVFTGRMQRVSFKNREVILYVRDTMYEQFRATLGDSLKVLVTSTFPNLPGGTESHLVPIVYGNCGLNPTVDPPPTGYAGGGPVPCYRIDPSINSKWRYVVAQHLCVSVDYVFVYGVLQSSGYLIDTAVYDGVTMTVINFDSDPMIAGREAELEITAAVQGISADGVTLLENPLSVLKHFLNTYGSVLDTDLDLNLWTQATDLASDNGYKSTFALVDRRLTLLDIIERHCESFLISFYTTKQSKYSVYLRISADSAGEVIAIAIDLTDRIPIIKDSFQIDLNDDPISTLQYNFMYQWVKDYFERQPDYAIPNEAAKHIVVNRKSINLWHVRHVPTAEGVVIQYGDLFRENTDYTTVDVTPDLFRSADLNRWTTLTHYQGIAASGDGFVNEQMRIVEMHIEPKPTSTLLRLKLIRIPG